MKGLNLPPFFVGQKVVSLVDGYQVKKGDVKTVLSCFKCCCQWHIDIGLLSPVSRYLICNSCGQGLELILGNPFYPEAVCFAPVQENFQSISLEKILEKETSLISAS